MTLLAAVCLAAIEPSGVFVLSRQGVPNEELRKAMATLHVELGKVAGGSLTTEETLKELKAAGPEFQTCSARPSCLLPLAAKAKLGSLITVAVSKVGSDRAWVVEVHNVRGSTRAGREEWLDTAGDDIAGPAARLADRVRTLFKPADAPVALKVEPPVKPLIVEQPIARPTVNQLPRFLLIGAGVAAAVGIGLMVGGGITNGRLQTTTLTPDGLKLSPFTMVEAQSMATTSNALTGLGVVALIAAAGLGGAAFLMW